MSPSSLAVAVLGLLGALSPDAGVPASAPPCGLERNHLPEAVCSGVPAPWAGTLVSTDFLLKCIEARSTPAPAYLAPPDGFSPRDAGFGLGVGMVLGSLACLIKLR